MEVKEIVGQTIKWITIALIIGHCASCSPLTKAQRQENRVAKKIQKLQRKYPAAFDSVRTVEIRLDTLIQEVEVAGETRVDTLLVVETLTELLPNDTVYIPQIITTVLEQTRDTVQVDTAGVHLWIAGSAVQYRVKRDSIHIQETAAVETIVVTETTVTRDFWNDWKFWILLLILALLVIFRDTLVSAVRRRIPGS